MKKQYLRMTVAGALMITGMGTAFAHGGGLLGDNTIHQYAPTVSLLNTVYDGELKVGDMAKQGDIGLGTVNGLAGELVAVDSVIYLIDAKGGITVAPDDMKSPSMTMLDFHPTKTVEVANVDSMQSLSTKLQSEMDSKNSFYSYKMHGTFPFLRMASAHKVKDDNVPLFEYLATREMYTRENIKGTLVGLYTPEYLGNISIPGLHLHFLSDDLTLGGHLEDIKLDKQTVDIEEINQINLTLPKVEKFRQKTLEQMPAPAATASDK